MSSRTARTRRLILAFLRSAEKPIRCSEIRKAVVEQYPLATVYSALQDMWISGAVKRVSCERDAKYEPGKLRFLEVK